MIDIYIIRYKMKVYPKDSMDRFGDDMTELILSYLPFKDKIRLESVSKQWQRCISEKQFELELLLNSKKIYPSFGDVTKVLRYKYHFSGMFESVAKKFPYITKVSVTDEDNKSEVLSLIGRYCPNIKSLKYKNVSTRIYEDIEFFRMYGHKLEELHLYGIQWAFNGYLIFCSNVKTIYVDNMYFLFNEDKEYLPKLERIESFITINKWEIVIAFKILSEKYSQTMKSLKLKLYRLTEEDLKTCIECICRFENLTELILKIDSIEMDEEIDKSLSLIGEKCTKLFKYKLYIGRNAPISYDFFYIFQKYKAIKYLKLYLVYYYSLSGSIECFKYCKQLTELDIDYPGLREEFFANTELFIPKLQFLNITTEQLFSNTFFILFIKLKNIKKVELTEGNNSKKELCYYKKNKRSHLKPRKSGDQLSAQNSLKDNIKLLDSLLEIDFYSLTINIILNVIIYS